jgi:hypothetical protein
MERTVFNDYQLHMLNTMSHIHSPENMAELKKVVASYFAQKAEEEMKRMWESGEMNDEKFESFRTLHERTPYSKTRHAEHRP